MLVPQTALLIRSDARRVKVAPDPVEALNVLSSPGAGSTWHLKLLD